MIHNLLNNIKKVKSFLEIGDIKKTMLFILPYVKRYSKSYVSLLIVMLIDILITLLFAWLLKNTTDFAVQGNSSGLKNMLILGIFLIILVGVVDYLDVYLRNSTVSRVKRDVRTKLYDHIIRLPVPVYQQHHSGEYVSHLTNDVDQIDGAIGGNLLNLIQLPVMVISIFCFLVIINWKLSFLFLLVGPLAILSGAIFGILLRNNNRLIHQSVSNLHSFFNDSFASHIVLRSFTLQGYFSNKNKIKCDLLLTQELKEGKLRGYFTSGASIAGIMGYLLSIGLGAFFVSDGSMSVGALIGFVSLMQHLIYPLSNLAGNWGGFQKSMAAIDRVLQIFEQDTEKTSVYHSNDPTVKESITLEKVTFKYEEDHPVLNNLSLYIPARKVTALIGSSGTGKSTLINLLQGFFTPDQGQIYLDHQPLEHYSTEKLRKLFSYVPQESFLLDGTIKENISYGRLDANEKDIVQAAIDANAHEFICSLPNGYDTEIGERGVRLSGGQKQRIAIARALLKNAPILILDEATSSLDIETEQLIKEALEKLIEGKTTIIIAHRLSTIENADQIVVMDNGQVIEQGSHEELIELKGMYYSHFRLSKHISC